ncbi:MAG: phospho-sugar mutase, partial [Clostridia bacterium]|nr:phospho-sugar mutase [Clostridia bacterium]
MDHLWTDERDRWLSSDKVSEEDKEIIRSMTEDEARGAFSSQMAFGTAGLRSVMGPGIARMNLHTVAQATAGLAKYILSQVDYTGEKCVAIAYDSRHMSAEFALRSAQVLSSYGIRSHLFASLRPTPMLSYAVRRLGCIAGINVTASHNAKEYNGYKVYWEDGAQIGTEQAKAISALIGASDLFEDVPSPEESRPELISEIPASFDQEYIREVLSQRVDPSIIAEVASELDIVYTPLHGTGATIMPTLLREAGLSRIHFVEEQMIPDGDFPTAPYPNPENADVFTLGIEQAEKYGSDLVIATDPDGDRVGTMVRNPEGQFVRLTGNQMGALLLDYLIASMRENGTLPKDAYVVKSFVSTMMADAICEKNSVDLYHVLTGFKYIGEVIKLHEKKGRGTFLLGFEESYGYLKGTYARDKDAMVATLLICEMAAYYHRKNMTLYDAMQSLFAQYGFFAEEAFSIVYSGADASAKMAEAMTEIRNNPPEKIGEGRVLEYSDYLSGRKVILSSGDTEKTDLPEADALQFDTDEKIRVIVRPSGTEPKVKIYLLSGDES